MRRRSPASKKSPNVCPPSAKQPTNYVYLSGFVLIPDDVLPMLAEAVVLDYDYVDNKRLWILNKTQALNIEFWGADKVNAMRVANQLES